MTDQTPPPRPPALSCMTVEVYGEGAEPTVLTLHCGTDFVPPLAFLANAIFSVLKPDGIEDERLVGKGFADALRLTAEADGCAVDPGAEDHSMLCKVYLTDRTMQLHAQNDPGRIGWMDFIHASRDAVLGYLDQDVKVEVELSVGFVSAARSGSGITVVRLGDLL